MNIKDSKLKSFVFSQSNGESNDSQDTHLELAFEYLIAKDTLKWITIYSDQVNILYGGGHLENI